MKKLPDILSTRTVCSSRLFRVDAVQLRFANGIEAEYERIGGVTEGNAVMIVPMLEDGRLLFVSEYSVGTERYEIVFPKGRIDPGEQSIEAAQRELREETGYRANHLSPMQSVSVAPGYASFATDMWCAQGLQEAPLEGDEPEPLEPVIMSVDEALNLARDENAELTLTEARTLLAVYLVREMIENDQPRSR